MSDPPRISVVIPAYNEEKYLPRLIDSLSGARAAYRLGPGAVEVIVADNASTDATARVAAERGCRPVRVERRTIAAARNGGAREARGSILAFVDADTVRVHPRTFDVADDLLSSGRYVSCATGVGMERWSAGIAVAYAMMIPLVWLTGMDTGVVFCRKRDFEAVGGYDESLRVAEDVKFLWALRRHGRRDGRRLARARSVKAVASCRKFDEHGDWHYVTAMPALVFKVLLKGDTNHPFIERYWYSARK